MAGTSGQFRDNDGEDTTMPTWGLSTPGMLLDEYENKNDASQDRDIGAPKDARSLETASDDDASSRSSTPSLRPPPDPQEYDFSPTDFDYTSAFDGDVDTNASVDDLLDDLLPISPLSSRPPTPIMPPEGNQTLLDHQTMEDRVNSPVSTLLYSNFFQIFNVHVSRYSVIRTMHHSRLPRQLPRCYLTLCVRFVNGS